MLDTLKDLDTVFFLLFNVGLANPVTDFIMPIITSDKILRAGYLVTMILLLWRGNTKVRWIVLASAIVLAFSDQLSSHLLKPMIGRIRPCHVLDDINLLVGCGGGLSMPSSHAANAFGQAILFRFHFPRVRSYLFVLALLIASSRVFVGVHYPGDVLGGLIVGIFCGMFVALIFDKVLMVSGVFQPNVSKDKDEPSD